MWDLFKKICCWNTSLIFILPLQVVVLGLTEMDDARQYDGEINLVNIEYNKTSKH